MPAMTLPNTTFRFAKLAPSRAAVPFRWRKAPLSASEAGQQLAAGAKQICWIHPVVNVLFRPP